MSASSDADLLFFYNIYQQEQNASQNMHIILHIMNFIHYLCNICVFYCNLFALLCIFAIDFLRITAYNIRMVEKYNFLG